MGNFPLGCDKKRHFQEMTKMWHDEIAKELIKVGVEQKVAEGTERLPENYLQMRSSDDGVDIYIQHYLFDNSL